MNDESTSGDERNEEERIEEVKDKIESRIRTIPDGIHTDKLHKSLSRGSGKGHSGTFVNKRRNIPVSDRRFRRELERQEKKEMKKNPYLVKRDLEEKEGVLNLDDSINEMIKEIVVEKDEKVEENQEEKDLKPNGEEYKTTRKQREDNKKYREENKDEIARKRKEKRQREKKNQKQREKRQEEKRIRDENRPELERSIVKWISEKKENRLKKQRDSSKKTREKIKEEKLLQENTMDTKTIYFRLEDDGMGHLTLPSDLVDDLVKGSREVNLSFTFQEEKIFSDNEFGKVSIDYIPVGTEDKNRCLVGEMFLKKTIEFLTPEKEKN